MNLNFDNGNHMKKLFFFVSVLLLANPFPAEANSYLVFPKGKDRATILWNAQTAPDASKVPEGATVMEVPKGMQVAHPDNFVIENGNLVRKPVELSVPVESPARVAKRKVVSDLCKELELAAVDPKVTDDQYQKLKIKLERAKAQ